MSNASGKLCQVHWQRYVDFWSTESIAFKTLKPNLTSKRSSQDFNVWKFIESQRLNDQWASNRLLSNSRSLYAPSNQQYLDSLL
uniref:AlNc14C5G683 protein n=1 Tax=Albugo laibachii Nc14 TaxID=890382 RepID=F0W0P8_9STRA|nr:AlNc14C5G683 [Albugo laibachii Nc14]|eukprot:CCA14622.1 AlNc14C5G683 [Albugo laibachii Nc14]